MQRQSLGSPVSKLHIHGGGGGGGSSKEDLRLTELHPSSSSSTSATSPTVYDDDDESKTTKPRRFSLSPPPLALSSSLSTHSRPEKLIHLIPLLTLFCFLVLYFSSHSPSPSPSGRCTYSLVSFFIFHFFLFSLIFTVASLFQIWLSFMHSSGLQTGEVQCSFIA